MSDQVPLKAKPLTTPERAFIAEYFRNGMKIGKAWEVLHAGCSVEESQSRGSDMLRRIKRKTQEWNTILEAAGLDDFTLAGEVRKKLRAKKTKFYKGAPVGTTDDNGTQMRAVELLAELRGRRKSTLIVEEETPPITISEDEE